MERETKKLAPLVAEINRHFERYASLSDDELPAKTEEFRSRLADGETVDDLLARLAVRRCQYCGAELPLDEDIASCPNCGGTIETRVEKLSLSGDEYFDMDG